MSDVEIEKLIKSYENNDSFFMKTFIKHTTSVINIKYPNVIHVYSLA